MPAESTRPMLSVIVSSPRLTNNEEDRDPSFARRSESKKSFNEVLISAAPLGSALSSLDRADAAVSCVLAVHASHTVGWEHPPMRPFIFIVGAALLATPSHGQDADPGRLAFESHCARCHGADASGSDMGP